MREHLTSNGCRSTRSTSSVRPFISGCSRICASRSSVSRTFRPKQSSRTPIHNHLGRTPSRHPARSTEVPFPGSPRTGSPVIPAGRQFRGGMRFLRRYGMTSGHRARSIARRSDRAPHRQVLPPRPPPPCLGRKAFQRLRPPAPLVLVSVGMQAGKQVGHGAPCAEEGGVGEFFGLRGKRAAKFATSASQCVWNGDASAHSCVSYQVAMRLPGKNRVNAV